MFEPNRFQLWLEEEIGKLLEIKYKEMTSDPADSEKPAVVLTVLDGAKIWLYDDEAQIHSDTLDVRLEAPDYENGEKLGAAFLRQLKAIAANAS